jgi:hypothetical protein
MDEKKKYNQSKCFQAPTAEELCDKVNKYVFGCKKSGIKVYLEPVIYIPENGFVRFALEEI